MYTEVFQNPVAVFVNGSCRTFLYTALAAGTFVGIKELLYRLQDFRFRLGIAGQFQMLLKILF